MQQLGVQSNLIGRKSKKYFATVAVYIDAIPATEDNFYICLNFPSKSGGILLSIDEANKLASEILRTTRNLPKG